MSSLDSPINSDAVVPEDSLTVESIDEDLKPKWTSEHEFTAGLNLDSDLYAGATVIWDSTDAHIEQSVLENTSVSINGSNGISAGTVSLGDSLNISISGTLTLDSDLETVDGDTLWDEGNSYIPQTRLENDSITLNGGNGLKNGSQGSLGGSFSLDIDPDDFTGDTLEVDNSDVVDVNLDKGIVTTPGGALTFDETDSYDFTDSIAFDSDVSFNSHFDVTPAGSEPAAPSTSSVARIFVEDTNPPQLSVKDSTGDKMTVITLGG